jgi:acyl-CoA reductase-like NAD-dependent aldehyde dehydrogenase
VTAVFDIVNPATEEIVTSVEETSLEQADAAIERAAAAFPAWRAVATAAGCCAASPWSSTTISRSWPSWR